MNPFKDIIVKQGKDGRYFILHWKYRFDPVTIAVAGLATQAYGQIQEGQAAAAQAKSEQNMANYNAALQEREAVATEQRTMLQQRRQAEEAARKMGTLRAGLGASGAVSTAGTALTLQMKQAAENDLENAMIGYQGREEAAALRSGAGLSRMEGDIAKQRGKSAKKASYIGAGTSLLTGFGNAYTPKTSAQKDAALAKKHGI